MTNQHPTKRPCALAWEAPRISHSEHRTSITFRTRVPEDYPYFEGHFHSYPVLAGAVQLHELVLPCLRRARPGGGQLSALSGLKFPSRIAPGDTVDVTLGFRDGSHEVDFRIDRDTVRCTHGRLTLTDLPDAEP